MGWEQFNKYVGIQGILALVIVSVYAYATITNIPLSPEFNTTLGAVLGFFFGKNGLGFVSALKSTDKKG